MMEKLGLTPEHRKSFRPVQEIWMREEEERKTYPVSNLKPKNKLTTSELGSRGESVVSDYLEKLGHEILFRNFKTKQYEIDLVSKNNDQIYFTEVKYRKNNQYGEPLEFVDQKKHKQMEFAAKAFLHTHAEFSRLVPHLAVASVNGDFVLDEWFLLTE